jgi:Tfp pilus assembly protein PilN
MAARQKQSQINLLPQREFASSTLGRILAWILSTFRIIVIVTEIIVMVAFLSRFWLDAKNNDLNEEIQQKQAVLAASLPFENDFRQIQKQLEIYSVLAKDKDLVSNTIFHVVTSLPPDVVLDDISLNDGSFVISGLTPSEVSIQHLLANLQSISSLENVSLGEIKSSQEETSLLSFKIKAEIKKGG